MDFVVVLNHLCSYLESKEVFVSQKAEDWVCLDWAPLKILLQELQSCASLPELSSCLNHTHCFPHLVWSNPVKSNPDPIAFLTAILYSLCISHVHLYMDTNPIPKDAKFKEKIHIFAQALSRYIRVFHWEKTAFSFSLAVGMGLLLAQSRSISDFTSLKTQPEKFWPFWQVNLSKGKHKAFSMARFVFCCLFFFLYWKREVSQLFYV